MTKCSIINHNFDLCFYEPVSVLFGWVVVGGMGEEGKGKYSQ